MFSHNFLFIKLDFLGTLSPTILGILQCILFTISTHAIFKRHHHSIKHTQIEKYQRSKFNTQPWLNKQYINNVINLRSVIRHIPCHSSNLRNQKSSKTHLIHVKADRSEYYSIYWLLNTTCEVRIKIKFHLWTCRVYHKKICLFNQQFLFFF